MYRTVDVLFRADAQVRRLDPQLLTRPGSRTEGSRAGGENARPERVVALGSVLVMLRDKDEQNGAVRRSDDYRE